MRPLRPVPLSEWKAAPFTVIGSRWMLITAGPPDDCNTMTASWGGFGTLWERPVAFVFVRPTRHTYDFMERHPVYTLSFLPEEMRPALTYLGTHSGRDGNKIAAAGLTCVPVGEEGTTFDAADTVVVCRRIYSQDLSPSLFQSQDLHSFYPEKDYHRLYIGEVTGLFVWEDGEPDTMRS